MPELARFRRYFFHLSLFLLNETLYRIVLQGAVVTFLLSRETGGPRAPALLTLLAWDLASYGLHLAHHRIGWLWRIHRVHHSDPRVDLSTGLRLHFLQLATGALGDLLVIALCAPTRATYVAYCALRFGAVLFHHAALSLPPGLERAIGWCVVTPAHHLRHHRRGPAGEAVHFGAIFSVWDRILGTLDRGPETPLCLGVVDDGAGAFTVEEVLWSPFRRSAG
jgi:sterol desaturase/sphingolipid hydroxylase (fatty acid hydroxylase superfamily)